MIQNKKTFLIPGWMNGGGMYSEKNHLYEILEVWKNRINSKEKINAAYLIGHSVGCNWALLSWQENKNSKLILVNPLLPKRSMLNWFSSWREFHKKEVPPQNKEVISGIKNKLFGIRQCFNLLKSDFDGMLSNIPKENITIICGQKDTFYCDEKFKNYIKLKNIKLIEIENAGHDWSEKFDKEIERIILN